MFATTKTTMITTPAKSVSNSRNKFIAELNANEQNLCNRSFDTAQKYFEKNVKLKQSKLCLRALGGGNVTKAELGEKVEYTKLPLKTEFQLLPIKNDINAIGTQRKRKRNLNKTIATASCELHHGKHELMPAPVQLNLQQQQQDTKPQLSKNLLLQSGRNLKVLMGNVDFSLKMQKLYPNVNAIWDIYGTLLKITCGKQRFEYVLLIRNARKNNGPILQLIFYDFNGIIKQFAIGCHLRAIGRFLFGNRLRTFKLQAITEYGEWQETHFTRIQNVLSFVLQQNI